MRVLGLDIKRPEGDISVFPMAFFVGQSDIRTYSKEIAKKGGIS